MMRRLTPRIASLTASLALAAVTGPGTTLAAPAPDAAQLKQAAFTNIDAYTDRMGRIGDAIFSYSEIGFQEVKTVDLLTKELTAHGFTVKKGVAGMATAYMANYCSGRPRGGLLSGS